MINARMTNSNVQDNFSANNLNLHYVFLRNVELKDSLIHDYKVDLLMILCRASHMIKNSK